MNAAALLLVSVPSQTGTDTFEQIHKKVTLEQQLCSCYRFALPKLRVGKLDTLVALSDSLQKDDITVEATLWRLQRQYKEWSGSDVFIPKVDGQNLLDYVIGFRWSEEKFSSTEPLANIVQSILGQVHSFEEELKKRTTDYAQRKQIASAEERKTSGSLMVRSLEGLVDPQKCTETEHLTSVFFVLPKHNEKDFLASYEKLASLVVPRSAQRWTQDNEWVLYSITIFRSCLEELKKNAREKRYTIREYSRKSGSTSAESDHWEESLESLRLRSLEWITTAFSETAIAWTHLKAIRLFVESVLRFGLPVNVETILLLPYAKTQRKLLKTLDRITSQWISGNPEYFHNEKSSSTSDDRYASLLGISIQEELHPFVLLEWNMMGKET
ncbi:hypothetical protein GpartN1_g3013.t1 [Galdieria partita]|uniref:V-type proton ATPase subunit C n=1 Tax=Galdieria partita TaxID=83374 RepID=A0A9C7PWI4_9RHOD|nr:hypothetical protein GpartN1_g3013.t1 [Galdieria partita]